MGRRVVAVVVDVSWSETVPIVYVGIITARCSPFESLMVELPDCCHEPLAKPCGCGCGCRRTGAAPTTLP